MDLFPESYYNKCQSVAFGSPSLSDYINNKSNSVHDEKFKTSKLYKEITGIKTTEYQLLAENKPKVLSALKKLDSSVYDVETLKKYEYKMYQKRYREWDVDKCFYEFGTERIDITPKTLKNAIAEVDFYIDWSWGLLLATGFILVLLLAEIKVISMYKQQEIGKTSYGCLLCLRKLLSLAVVSLWAYDSYVIDTFHGHA